RRQLSLCPPFSRTILPRLLCSAKRGKTRARFCQSGSRNACEPRGPYAYSYDVSGASRTTSRGFLSSRKPRNTGARNFLSRVHSANLISATNFGLIQCIFFIIEGV